MYPLLTAVGLLRQVVRVKLQTAQRLHSDWHTAAGRICGLQAVLAEALSLGVMYPADMLRALGTGGAGDFADSTAIGTAIGTAAAGGSATGLKVLADASR